MTKYKLLKDLPFGKEGEEVDYDFVEQLGTGEPGYFLTFQNGEKIWLHGYTPDSDWFEEVKPERCDCKCCEHEDYGI